MLLLKLNEALSNAEINLINKTLVRSFYDVHIWFLLIETNFNLTMIKVKRRSCILMLIKTMLKCVGDNSLPCFTLKKQLCHLPMLMNIKYFLRFEIMEREHVLI